MVTSMNQSRVPASGADGERARPTAIIVGASSGIGRRLAEELAQRGWRLGLASRRIDQLRELATGLGPQHQAQALDATASDGGVAALHRLWQLLGHVDVLVLCSGVGWFAKHTEAERELATVAVNVRGFTALALAGFEALAEDGGGQLVGVSSVAGLRGNGMAPAYSASKAYVSTFLEALAQKARKQRLPVTVTDVRPGYVDTPLLTGDKSRLVWLIPVGVAARQICRAIERRRPGVLYVTPRWRLVAWLLRLAPAWLYDRV